MAGMFPAALAAARAWGQPSDPFLMTGFDKKVLHVKTGKAAVFDVEMAPTSG